MTSRGASILLNRLQDNRLRLTEITLNANNLDDECMKAVGEYIRWSEYLEKINLSMNKISDKGIEILEPYLKGNSVLRLLNFQENQKVTDASILSITNMIETSHLEEVMLLHTAIEKQDVFLLPLAHNILRYEYENIDFSSRFVLHYLSNCDFY